ncbi:hypothetical protein B5E73_06780 [Ligilactobacillus salivarius]|uniref:restriction endonuclease subunit S n=1 Tax=Ligilactobacillus salivarius TaxID=1624 RepID=UPI000B39321F|nr:restriction endonuclease subunit S [Ligilactobacillus salivarius]OUQ31473.1 hypothetical protein B5E73_06780 [Ligilactobacillus salivarius]
MMRMKDSGIEWIGEIPETWKVAKIKYNLKRNDIKNHPNEEVLSVYRDYGVVPKSSRNDNHNVTSKDTTNYKYVTKGNLVINKMKAWQGSLAVSNYTGIVSPAYYVYKFTNYNLNKYYFHYLIRTCYKDEFMRLSTGIRDGQWDLQAYDFENTSITIPPKSEQQQIADFLDHKTAEIDGLIDKINTEIDTLKQYQSSVITRTVTKGLDPSVPMKDSGIKTVGTIPTKWKIGRIKYVAKIFGRIGFRGYTNADLVGEKEGAISLSPGNLSNGKLDLNKCAYLSWKKYYESPEIMINEHDIIIVKTGSSFGKIAWVDTIDHEMTLNPQLVVLKNIKISKKFLFYTLGTPLFKRQAEETVVGGTIPTMSQTSISNFKIVLPSKSEQQKIVDYLDQKVSQIQKIIESKQQQINQLTEYKNSLIFEYVTGKKQVKEAN